MSKESSSFISYRQIGDCRPNADIVVYFSGITADKPVLEGSTIIFQGGVANVPSPGIGVNGPSTSRGFRLGYDNIKPGGAGVKLRCPVTDTKQRLRFTVKRTPEQCQGSKTNIVSLHLKPVETCGKAYEFDEELPLHFFKRCSTLETDCQILEKVARDFNEEYAHLGTASTGMEGSIYILDIETKNVGATFRVLAHEGLSKPRIVVPGLKRTYTREMVQDWFKTAPNKPDIYTGADANLYAVELFTLTNLGTSFAGVATSDMSSAGGMTALTTIEQTVTVLFEDNVNANAALAELKKILKGPGSNNGAAPYLAKLVDDTCADMLYYGYTLVRPDAGDDAAYAAVKTDYADTKVLFRAGYIAGKSYYVLYTGANAVPTPGSAKPDDVVTKGDNQVPAPYTVSNCPAGTACADCPPLTGAPM